MGADDSDDRGDEIMTIKGTAMERTTALPKVPTPPAKTKIAIIGSGPAGLFCADSLAGYADVTIYEAGLPIEKRLCPETGCGKCSICHVLEGEGGAGGLSDGKNAYSLTRGTQSESIFHEKNEPLLSYVDYMMVKFAGEGIWYKPLYNVPKEFEDSSLKFESYPLRHVGSDGIRRFIRGFVDHFVGEGVNFRWRQRAMPVIDDGRAVGVTADGDRFYPYDITILAAGLQGIPWVENLMVRIGSPLSSGPAGFGLRLETDAEILAPLFKHFYDFKLVLEQSSDLTVRSFCCNQNGYVLNERHTDLYIVNVNGHSYLDPTMRTKSSNMAIIAKLSDVSPTPQDFVRSLGRRICYEAGRSIYAGCPISAYQPVTGFMKNEGKGALDSSYITNKQARYCDIASLLPEFLLEAFRRFIQELNLIVPVISPKSIIYAPEIKYYGRRVNVTPEWRCKDVKGLYIVGSGSGYLDSFVAAALSGIIAAEDIKKEVLNVTTN